MRLKAKKKKGGVSNGGVEGIVNRARVYTIHGAPFTHHPCSLRICQLWIFSGPFPIFFLERVSERRVARGLGIQNRVCSTCLASPFLARSTFLQCMYDVTYKENNLCICLYKCAVISVCVCVSACELLF